MRAAVVIGVDLVGGGLKRLQAAANGAVDVARWLRRSDYKVSLLTDHDAPVERSAIFRAVTSLVEAGTVERLVIYFAGHGFLKGPLDEYWLLSGAPIDASEAVNVTSSAAMARYRGIPEIIFVSDACRVTPTSSVHAGINGVSIFPNLPPSGTSAAIDFYYGTQPGDPAHERTSSEAVEAHGLFTQELLDAHKAAPAEALLTIGDRTYVRNDWLQSVLRDRVNARAEGISLRLTQLPDVQIQIRDGYIAVNEGRGADDARTFAPIPPSTEADAAGVVHGPGHPAESGATDKGGRSSGMPRTALARHVRRGRGQDPVRPRSMIGDAARASGRFQDRVRVIRDAGRPTWAVPPRSEQDPTLTCVGDVVTEVVPAAGTLARPDEEGDRSTWRFRTAGPASQVALRFADGSGMLVPLLRGFTARIVRHDRQTLSVSYSWLGFDEPHLAELRAEVFGAATLGLLQGDREATQELARRLRQGKRFDPTLGLVAALAYTLAGFPQGATSIRRYMREDLRVDIFDAWLLGGGEADGILPIYPSLPLLSQTWSLIDLFDAPMSESVRQLRRVPGFWSVYEAGSMDRVMGLVQDHTQPGSAG